MEINKPDLCIVYDERTTNQAHSLYNKLAEKCIKCKIMSEKQYEDGEIDYTNYNRILFFSKKLIEKNLSLAEEKELLQGVRLLRSGCAFGISVDPSAIIKKKKRFYWWSIITFQKSTYEGLLSAWLYNRAVKYLTEGDNILIILPKQIDC